MQQLPLALWRRRIFWELTEVCGMLEVSHVFVCVAWCT